MSNARNLANLLGNGTTIATASIADDAITAAKIDDDGTGFTFGDLTVAGAVVGDGFTSVDKLKLDGSSVATVTVNSAVSASATIVVDGVAGTIVVGMVVNVSDISVRSISDAASQTAISTDDSLTITAVASQTSFTVSEAVTIADNVVLILTADESGGFVLDASAASTDVGEEILFESATADGSISIVKNNAENFIGTISLTADSISEGGAVTTNIAQGLTKVWCAWTGVSVGIYDSFNVSGMTDTSNVINLVSYTNGFNTAGHMAISYSSNHNGGGLNDSGNSDIAVFEPNPSSSKYLSTSNQNAAYQNCNISGDLA